MAIAVEYLTNADGTELILQQGESTDIELTFTDIDGVQLAKSDIVTLVVTQFELATQKLINARDAQSVYDTNGGSLANDGTLTWRIDADDTAIVNQRIEVGSYQTNVLYFAWTWNDGVADRTGKGHTIGYKVERLAVPT